MNALLELRNIRHAYGKQVVVNDLSLTLRKGQIGCLLGPSGCGKTTVLRCIAGFEPISAGEILVNNVVVSNANFCMLPERRHIGMVFQDYALFPHLTVAANIGFGLHRMQKTERDSRVAELLQTVGLADTAAKYPHELSGGQQQRVAIARALAQQPSILLADEPTGNLDSKSGAEVMGILRNLHRERGLTVVMVTHDPKVAAQAQRIIHIQDGLVVDEPEKVAL